MAWKIFSFPFLRLVSDKNLTSLLVYGVGKFDDTKISNFSDNLQACYAYAVIFVCFFAKSFVLSFQRASFTRYFTSGFFL